MTQPISIKYLKRVDLYSPTHKALRKALFELSIKISEIDVTNETQLDSLLEQVKKTFDSLHDHGRHEESFLHPLLELVPQLSTTGAQLDQAHAHHTKDILRLENDAQTLKKVTGDEREALAMDFYRNLNIFISEYLLHLSQEEANLPNLFDHFEDARILNVMCAFKASEGAPGAVEDLAALFPNLPEEERIRLTKGLKLNSSVSQMEKIRAALKLPEV